MQKILPFLWFDTQAEEAMNFYVATFKNSKVGKVSRFPEGAPMPAGMVMTCDFELDGQPFTALNGGPMYQFTEAVSFSVSCEDQAEVDHLWDRLTSDGGKEQPCGWLKDRFGLSWQIVPKRLMELLGHPDKATAQRVMTAMLQMTKIDIAALEEAAAG